jgi:hypothetical protein
MATLEIGREKIPENGWELNPRSHDSMKSGNLRVGLYVIDGDGGMTETFIHNLDPVHTPIPGAVLLFGSGLIGLLFLRRKKLQQAS